MLMLAAMSIAVLLLFALLLLLAGLPGRDVEREFFLAGRRAGTVSVAGSLLATCLGASATLGLSGLAYRTGWMAFWWLGSGALGLLLLSVYWAAPMRLAPDVRTLPQWLGHSYGNPARRLAALLIILMWTAVIAAQWVAAGRILDSLFPHGPGYGASVALVAAVVAAYTALGGQRAVLRTDLVQLLFIAAALVLPVLFLARLPGAAAGWPRPSALLPEGAAGLGPWLALLLVNGGMYVAGPDLCSRVLLARDVRVAQRGALVAALLLVPCGLTVTWIGVAIRAAGLIPVTPEAALPCLLTAGVMPTWAVLLVQVGLVAALMSSADTCLLTAGSVLVLDLLPGATASREGSAAGRPAGQEGRGRLAVLAFALVSVVVAIVRPAIIPNLLLAYAFYAGGLLPPLLLLRFPARASRLPRRWVWVAMVGGGLTPVALLRTGLAADAAVAGAYGFLVASVVLAGGWGWSRLGRARAPDSAKPGDRTP